MLINYLFWVWIWLLVLFLAVASGDVCRDMRGVGWMSFVWHAFCCHVYHRSLRFISDINNMLSLTLHGFASHNHCTDVFQEEKAILPVFIG